MNRILDLFCGLGGASAGYRAAGFEVIGVDLKPQPDYPWTFVQADALDILTAKRWLAWRGIVGIHASPPCQATAAITRGTNAHMADRYTDLYPQVRELLQDTGLPYVIENPSARPDVVLCGEMFGLGVIRHRRFELGGWTMAQPQHRPHRGRVRGWRHGVYHDGPYVAAYGKGGGKASVSEIRHAMGIAWSDDRAQLVEAIPPAAYTNFIGTGLRMAT